MKKGRPYRNVCLGLDLSVKGTGAVVLQEKNPIPLTWKYLQTDVLKSGTDRLKDNGVFVGCDEARINFIALNLIRVFRKFQPDLIVVENYSFGSRGRGLTILHELAGVLKHRLWLREAVWTVLAPQTLKKHATGHGGASKDEMVAAAQKRWSDCPDVDDIADAYWLADWGLENIDKVVEPA